jgi:hypothetical protein
VIATRLSAPSSSYRIPQDAERSVRFAFSLQAPPRHLSSRSQRLLTVLCISLGAFFTRPPLFPQGTPPRGCLQIARRTLHTSSCLFPQATPTRWCLQIARRTLHTPSCLFPLATPPCGCLQTAQRPLHTSSSLSTGNASLRVLHISPRCLFTRSLPRPHAGNAFPWDLLNVLPYDEQA